MPKTIISDLNLNISYHTLLRHLKNIGYPYKKVQKTQCKRLKYCCNAVNITELNNILIFSDEKRFCLDGVFPGEKRWVRPGCKSSTNVRYVSKNYEKNSIMVWGAVSSLGVVYLDKIRGTLRSDGYIELLDK